MPAQRELAAAGLTLGRLCEIQRGEGPPPTDAELEAIAEFEARLRRSPSWRRLEKTVATARKITAEIDVEKFAKAKRVYKAASPAQQRRMASMTASQVLALHGGRRLTQAPGRVRCREPRRRPTARRATAAVASRDGPSGSSKGSDPHLADDWPRTIAVLVRLQARIERRQHRRFEHHRQVVA